MQKHTKRRRNNKVNKSKKWFFEKSSKIHTCLMRYIKKEKRERKREGGRERERERERRRRRRKGSDQYEKDHKRLL